MGYTHDIPESKGVENGIKRARQMTALRWAPVKPLASSTALATKDGWKFADTFFPSAFPQYGVVYSSVLKSQKYIGYNVSFETFMTALADENSVLYKESLHGQGRERAGCLYGIVCSCFASYVHDLPDRIICRDWPSYPGISFIGKPDVSELRLLDLVLTKKGHIAVVTDILRDEDGKARLIEVSEATLPLCRATVFTDEEFVHFWYDDNYDIYRNENLSGISYEPSPFVRIEEDMERGISGDPELPVFIYNRALMPDHGNRSNYQAGEEIVIDILDDAYSFVEISGAAFEERYLPKDGKVTPGDLPAGAYRAIAGNEAAGEVSDPVLFSVTDLTLIGDRSEYRPGEEMVLRFSTSSADVPHLININRALTYGDVEKAYLIPEQKAEKEIRISVPGETGEFFAYLSCRNDFGIYTSNRFEFRVTDEPKL